MPLARSKWRNPPIIQYATPVEKLLFWLRLAAYFRSDFSRNAYIQFLIVLRGAKREFLKNQILILQRHSRRHLFFLGGCQETFLPHDIHHSSFTGYSLHTAVYCSGTAGNKVHLVHFQRLPYSVYSSTAVRTACGIVARTATQPTRSTLRTLGVKVLPLLLTAGLAPPASVPTS